MMRSLYSGVTGLRSHQTKMDVIGNNIANVNTAGFKASRVIFQDIYSQTVAPASAATASTGGTNPQQIGLGVQLATIDVLNTEASSQYTGNTLDLAIDGDGYFVIRDGASYTYTRAGNFYTDSEDYLVDSNGNYVIGYEVNEHGSLVYRDADNAICAATAPGAHLTMQRILVDPDYYDVSISANGQVVGLDEVTSESTVLGQLMLATFANPNGLEKTGENAYRSTVNSGDPVYNVPGEGGTGSLNPGSLEMSNVDLTAQFADMIVTQRGFQANSRIITTTDEMLEELVNMVR
jgi:fagellar hook-basal body proteins/fagellar hook-basal body proteins